MKRIIFSCAAVLFALTCSAQKVQILERGEVIYEHDMSDGIEVVIKDDPYNGHEYVDLGLPSGTLWATCNVGANSPEEYGDYFAWGETEPYYTEGHSLDGYSLEPCESWMSGKTGYNWASYKWCTGSEMSMTKYCTSSSYGTVDNKTQLDPEDDVAHVKWGGDWRMPTDEELTELWAECKLIQTSQGGVPGLKATGPNGNSVFLPKAGYRSNRNLSIAGGTAYYWSSSLKSTYSPSAWSMCLTGGLGSLERCYGCSVRPVCSK